MENVYRAAAALAALLGLLGILACLYHYIATRARAPDDPPPDDD
jgi:hypothetical protein